MAIHENGWYWVKVLDFDDTYSDWVPAEWREETRSWYSTRFRGIPDNHVQLGPKLVSPGNKPNLSLVPNND